MPEPPHNRVIICGLGHVGYRCAQLLARMGERGAVITREVHQQWRLDALPEFSVIQGDARDEKLLRQAGVEQAQAIIVVTDDDLANVSIALDARRLNPTIAIVVRMFDQDMAAHLEQSGQVQRALSASALAAPAFVAAALGASVCGSFPVDGRACVVSQHLIAAPPAPHAPPTLGVWAAQTGHIVIAMERGGQLALRPASDVPLADGDRLTCLKLSNRDAVRRPARARGSSLRALVVGVRQWWCDVPRPVRRGLTALLTLVVMSVVVFRVALGIPLVDALYFVVTTVTTVGYGDYNLLGAPAWLKLFGSLVMISGVALLAALVSIITDLVLSMRLGDVLGHGRAQLQEHVIVAGLGDIGFRLVRDLVQSGEEVVAIAGSADGRYVDAARELAFVVIGNAKTEETLRRAGAAQAKAIIAVADDDMINLSIGLAAKRAGACRRTVVRMFDSQLAEKIQAGLPIDAVLSVSGAAVPTFVGAAFCPDILEGLLVRDWLVLIYAQTISPDSPLVGAEAGRLGARQSALLLKRAGGNEFVEAPLDYRLAPGDALIGAHWRSCAQR